MTDAASPAPAVFAWITGERTNLGDSLLRRPYIAALRRIGPTRLWVNRSERDFLSGLGLDGSEVCFASFPRWYGGLLASALRRRTILVLNAGEFRVHASRVALLIVLLLASVLVRIRGGSTVWIGVSVPPTPHRILGAPVRWAARYLDYLQWRDDVSRSTGGPRQVGPDWAFATGTPTPHWPSTDRTRCAFVLRGDRAEPSAAWITWAKGFCGDHGLQPIAVVQVRQDELHARRLAAALGGEVFAWPPESSHAQHEDQLRALYRTCRVVIGDRLHGVVVGATEGAVPLGWVESSSGKIGRHLGVVGIDYAGEHEGRGGVDLPRVPVELTDRRASGLAEAIGGARMQLAGLTERLGSLRSEQHPASLTDLGAPQRSRARRRAARNASE
ncbi:polysaccharide pyruvyl transferase family protein [Microbacterium sp. NPDC055357]